jgi:mercuric ion transport protein
MKTQITTTQNCCCTGKNEVQTVKESSVGFKKNLKGIPSVLLSVLIAFFPKCPLCWAVYMSMFSCLGLSKLPYMGWLLPVLIGFLGIHLYVIYKKSIQNRHFIFMLSLLGALVLILGRVCFSSEKWILFTGMGLLISGSLLNSFLSNRFSFFTPKHNTI